MANLFGWVKDEHKSNAKRHTRTSSTKLSSQLETWDGAIRTELDRDGNFTVYIGDKSNPRTIIATGNVNDGERGATGVDHTAPVYREQQLYKEAATA